MFRDVPGCSGMFRNVPGCSMYRVLSTALSLVCSADIMDTLCIRSFSHHVKQVNFVVLLL